MTPELIKEYYNKHHRELVYFSERLIGDFFAEDVVADCFIKLLEIDIEKYVNIKSLLYTMVRQGCLNVLVGKSRLKREKLIKGGEGSHKYILTSDYRPDVKRHFQEKEISDEYSDSSIIKAELIKIIVEKIEALPPGRRKIFNYIYINQLSTNEIVAITGLNENSIRVEKKRIVDVFKIYGLSIFNKNYWANYGPGMEHTLSKRLAK